MMNTYRESNAFLQSNNQELSSKVAEQEAKIKQLSDDMVPKDQELRQLTADKASLLAQSEALQNENKMWQERVDRLVKKYHQIDPQEHQRLLDSVTKQKAEIEDAKANAENHITALAEAKKDFDEAKVL